MATLRASRKYVGGLLAFYLVFCVAGGIALAEISLRLHKLAVANTDATRARIDHDFHVPVHDVAITAAEGAQLQAWYIEPLHGNGKSVIVLHGITANRGESVGYGEMFLNAGYAVLLPDSRDHGASGGRIATYGILERYDTRLWAHWLRQREPGCTYLLGESMGAAVGLQAAAVTPQLCAVAVESPYASFREISYERLGRGSHLGAWFWRSLGRPILEVAVAYTRLRYGIYLPDASPMAAVEHAKFPALLIAGDRDVEIPMHHAQELASACGPRCSLWIVPGAEHGGASSVAHAEFERRVLAWFSGHDGHD